MACATLLGSITGWTFPGITGVSSSELIATDGIETVGSWDWPALTANTSPLDATPDYISQAIPVTGGYAYTRWSFDGTTVDLVGPSGVIYSWTSSNTEAFALAVDASGDYWLIVELDSGSAEVTGGLYRVTPAGTATLIESTGFSDGISPGPIATTPDGAVWFSRFGTGAGLYRWDGSSTAVTGVGIVTPIPRPDSSVWFRDGGLKSVSAALVVNSSSPCPVLDSVSSYAVAWNADWSIVAVHDKSTGDIYQLARSARFYVGRVGFSA